MNRSAPISALVRPVAAARSTSSSRSVRPPTGWTGVGPGAWSASRCSRRTVSDGETRASPRAAASTASTSNVGPASLSRKPLAPLASAVSEVVVVVEGGDDDDGDGLGDPGAGEQPGGLQAIELGHADVEQAHVGAQALGLGDRGPAVADIGHHLDGRRLEDHPEARAHHGLIVGDQDPQGHARSPPTAAAVARAPSRRREPTVTSAGPVRGGATPAPANPTACRRPDPLRGGHPAPRPARTCR